MVIGKGDKHPLDKHRLSMVDSYAQNWILPSPSIAEVTYLVTAPISAEVTNGDHVEAKPE